MKKYINNFIAALLLLGCGAQVIADDNDTVERRRDRGGVLALPGRVVGGAVDTTDKVLTGETRKERKERKKREKEEREQRKKRAGKKQQEDKCSKCGQKKQEMTDDDDMDDED